MIDKIESLSKKIADFQKNRLQGALLRSKLPNFEEMEPSISFLNTLEKRKGEENCIFSVYDEETNTIKEDTEGIKESIYSFYAKLYKKDDEDERLQSKFLEQVDVKLEREDREALDRPLSERELYDALKSLPDNKSPGPSGLTKEFFMFFWEHLKPLYLKCVVEIKLYIELSEMQKRGAIKITHKNETCNTFTSSFM